MNADEFRRMGHRMVDWVAEYLESVERYPVLPRVAPGDIRASLPTTPPESGESMERIFEDFESKILPGVTHWNHPRFFAYFPANHSGPSILAELLSAALGVNGMVWQSCPSATELEEVVMDWTRQLIGLPDSFQGSIQDTASAATLCALLCAREQMTGFATNEHGMQADGADQRLRIYTSREAHSSVEKGAKIAGFGRQNVVLVDVDHHRAMKPEDLENRILVDQAAGWTPCCLVATVGTTSSTAIDPLAPLAKIANQYGLWSHVDAALAGSAAILPEMRWMLEGVEGMDSFVFNPHKWLFTNFDCSAFFCQKTDLLKRTFSILPEYLKTAQDSEATNYRDWGIPLGRRFRALKLWFVLRYYGVSGLRRKLRDHMELAQEFARWVDDSDDFERLAPVPLQTVCFRYHPEKKSETAKHEDQLATLNRELLEAANGSGRVFLTHTSLEGRFCLRLSVGQLRTTRTHVEQAWQTLLDHRPGSCARARMDP